MVVINTTPHVVNVLTTSGEKRVFEKSTCEVRVSSFENKVGTEEGMDIYKEELGPLCKYDPDDLIPKADVLIMSRMAANVARGMKEYQKHRIWIPGGLLRDEVGAVIGCKGFIEV